MKFCPVPQLYAKRSARRGLNLAARDIILRELNLKPAAASKFIKFTLSARAKEKNDAAKTQDRNFMAEAT